MPYFQISVVSTFLHCIASSSLKLPCDLLAATFRFNDMCRYAGRDFYCIDFFFLLNARKVCTFCNGCCRSFRPRRLTCLASVARSLVYVVHALDASCQRICTKDIAPKRLPKQGSNKIDHLDMQPSHDQQHERVRKKQYIKVGAPSNRHSLAASIPALLVLQAGTVVPPPHQARSGRTRGGFSASHAQASLGCGFAVGVPAACLAGTPARTCGAMVRIQYYGDAWCGGAYRTEEAGRWKERMQDREVHVVWL